MVTMLRLLTFHDHNFYFRMKRFLPFAGLLFFQLFFSAALRAQSLPVGTPVLEDTYRREQLLGQLDSSVSFMIRPVFPQQAFGTDDIFDPDRQFVSDGLLSTRALFNSADGKSTIQLLPVNWANQYNTHNPYGWNDGPMIPSAGYETLFSPGIYARWKFLSVQLQPEFVYAQNKNFDGFTQAADGNTAWHAWYNLYNRVDLPERFGTAAYSKVLPGQSSVRLTFGPVSAGVSTEDLWWGPGIRNSLVMSNNATGFLHLTFNTVRPLRTPIGSFEFQLIAGKLNPSGYSPLAPGQPGNEDSLYRAKPNDWRYLTGSVFTYNPKWVPGLFVGMTRVLQQYHQDMGSRIGDYVPLFLPILKQSYVNTTTGIDNIDASKGDQIASVFVRWLWPAANAEIYVEYGREDFSYNLKDLLLDPQHSRAYLWGFRKLIRLAARDAYLQVSVESTQLAKPADDLLERNSTPDWYANNLITAGYTNDGQVLGAGIGPGSGLQTLDLSWFHGIDRLGLMIERYEHSSDFYYQAFPGGEIRRHWVDYSVGLSHDWTSGHFVFTAGLTYIFEMNYEWKFNEDPFLAYGSQPSFNANNFKASAGVMYRF